MDLIVVSALLSVAVSIIVLWALLQREPTKWLIERQYYTVPQDDGTTTKQPFPMPSDAASVYLSIVVPAYNEQSRIQRMLDETIAYCDIRAAANKAFTWEIIVVDDGSSDQTSREVLKYVAQQGSDRLRLLTLAQNVGKGGAVKRGVMCARGQLILMADADAATDINDLGKLERMLLSLDDKRKSQTPVGEQPGVVVGSRAHLVDSDAVAKRAWYRNLPMYVFHFLVDNLCVKGIRDTQCGFKLFSRKAAIVLFNDLHIERWAFDVELLYLAQRRQYPVREVAVNWTEIDGSHLSIFGSSVQMFFDLLRIRFKYLLGKWQLSHL